MVDEVVGGVLGEVVTVSEKFDGQLESHRN